MTSYQNIVCYRLMPTTNMLYAMSLYDEILGDTGGPNSTFPLWDSNQGRNK